MDFYFPSKQTVAPKPPELSRNSGAAVHTFGDSLSLLNVVLSAYLVLLTVGAAMNEVHRVSQRGKGRTNRYTKKCIITFCNLPMVDFPNLIANFLKALGTSYTC